MFCFDRVDLGGGRAKVFVKKVHSGFLVLNLFSKTCFQCETVQLNLSATATLGTEYSDPFKEVLNKNRFLNWLLYYSEVSAGRFDCIA